MSCIARFAPDGPLTSNNDWELTFHLVRISEDAEGEEVETDIDITDADVTAVIRQGTDANRGDVVLEEKELDHVDDETGYAMLEVSHVENGPTSDIPAGWKGQHVTDIKIEFSDGKIETCGPLEFDVRRPIT